MKILISAAEASSDQHGAQLLEAIRRQAARGPAENDGHPPTEVDAFGIGGHALKAAGLRTLFDASEMLAMGTTEALGELPKLFKALRRIVGEATREQPAVAVVIDYPEFHFRLGKRLAKKGIPVIYYIPPKLWVWRHGRAKFLQKYFQKVLCIFPFEEAFLRSADVHATYVGNPLVDELPLKKSRVDARRDLGLPPLPTTVAPEGEGVEPTLEADVENPVKPLSELVVTLMPGSRPAEISAHLEIMLDAMLEVVTRMSQHRFQVLLPLSEETPLAGVQAAYDRWKASRPGHHGAGRLNCRIFSGNSSEALLASDAAIVKSGTSTLQAAVLGCPHVVVYRPSRLTGWIFKNLVRYSGPVALSNLVYENQVRYPKQRWRGSPARAFRELVMEEMTVANVALELGNLLGDLDRKVDVQAAIEVVRKRVVSGNESPSERAAREILAVARAHYRADTQPMAWAASFIWGTVNRLARRLHAWGFFSSEKLPSKVISVGNIQVGGAGKTPIVARIAKEAVARGKSVAILCRGYGSLWEAGGGVIEPGMADQESGRCGDEAALLHQLVPGAWIGVGANRHKQYLAISERLGKAPDVVVLDDGFQNFQIDKDIEVVAVTSLRPGERVFRDFRGALGQADLVVWTKGSQRPAVFGRPWAKVGFRLPAGQGDAVMLVTGLADGAFVKSQLDKLNWKVTKHWSFPDHARYDESTAKEILEQARAQGCRIALTGKDWVKWREFPSAKAQVNQFVVFEPELVFESGRENWDRVLWGK
ncbi:MAG: tetraacyldisaccharide 4'-kinase [Bacteriovoracia bacterium]